MSQEPLTQVLQSFLLVFKFPRCVLSIAMKFEDVFSSVFDSNESLLNTVVMMNFSNLSSIRQY